MSNQLVAIEQGITNSMAQIKPLLPSNISEEVFKRAAITAVTTGYGLMDATQDSVIQCLAKCATDGLMPDGKEAALVVYSVKDGNNWIKKAQYMPMVDGVLKRARMSGEVLSIAAKVVYENDEFDYWVDEHGEHFKHRPKFGARGEVKLVYAFAKLKTGDLVFEGMDREDIDRVRGASKNGDKPNSPWGQWYDRMACKSVLHRLARRLPNSSEMMQMLEMGNQMNWQKDEPQAKQEAPQEEVIEDSNHRIASLIKATGKTTEDFLKWISAQYKREVATLDDLSDAEKNAVINKLEANA